MVGGASVNAGSGFWGMMSGVDPLNPMMSPVMPAEWAQDQRLSFGARGILAELVDTAPGGEMSLDKLVRAGTESRDQVEGFLVELERVGYLKRDGECWYLFDPFTF